MNSEIGDPAGAALERATVLTDDLRLDAVRRWKEAHPGSLAIGILPVYAPRPLLEALGCLAVGVQGGGDQIDIIRGDSYFQSYICHIPRSVVELGLDGGLDPLDGMIFPSTCDVIRNLGGMWRLLFPDRYTAYLDLPQNFDPALGGRFYTGELRRIAGEIHGRGALPLDRDALREAIRRENIRRAALAEMDDMRRREPSRVPASEAYRVARAGSVLPAEEHTALIHEYLAGARNRRVRAYDNVRVVVLGAFCEQPPVGLIRTLEKAGCDLVDDDFQLGFKTVTGPIPLSREEAGDAGGGALDADDPVDALAIAFLKWGAPTATRYIGADEKGRDLVERVRQVKADGVVFAAASFCDPALLDQPMLEKALDEAGIPHTGFKYSENSAQHQTIREQAGAFSDAVKLWGGAP